MSGGYFNYRQLHIADIQDELEILLESEEFINSLSKKNRVLILEELSKAINSIFISRKYIQRVDYFLSGDDGEVNFLKKLKEDMNS